MTWIFIAYELVLIYLATHQDKVKEKGTLRSTLICRAPRCFINDAPGAGRYFLFPPGFITSTASVCQPSSVRIRTVSSVSSLTFFAPG